MAFDARPTATEDPFPCQTLVARVVDVPCQVFCVHMVADHIHGAHVVDSALHREAMKAQSKATCAQGNTNKICPPEVYSHRIAWPLAPPPPNCKSGTHCGVRGASPESADARARAQPMNRAFEGKQRPRGPQPKRQAQNFSVLSLVQKRCRPESCGSNRQVTTTVVARARARRVMSEIAKLKC